MKGGLLVPRNMHGGASTFAPLCEGREHLRGSENWVYVTTCQELAWAYAWAAAGRGKPRVLTVNPAGPLERDPEHSIDMEAYRCEAAFVVSVSTEPLMDEMTATAGWVV